MFRRLDMAYKSLYQFIHEALVRWSEQRRICSAIGNMVVGKPSLSTPPIVSVLKLLIVEGMKGTYETLVFAHGDNVTEYSIRYFKNGKSIDWNNLPISLVEPLMECFELLLDRFGVCKIETNECIYRRTAQFSFAIESTEVKISIIHESQYFDTIRFSSIIGGLIDDQVASQGVIGKTIHVCFDV